MGIRKHDQCFVETHKAYLDFALGYNNTPAPAPSGSMPINSVVDYGRVFFEDKTHNHNKALIVVKRTDADPCKLRLFVKTRDRNEPFSQLIPAAVVNEYDHPGSYAMQVENVEWVSLACEPTGGVPGYCVGKLIIQKTFCICCKNNG
ncbi:hypothetical protein BEP19_09445 [Ammoniphilus oxalaticus]|uniref:Uncharacterized protein n=1 Tax=Ammoniphilus oxalaticus TaxID=66863 RepID=A0A419SKQ3_9BACL|nr:hypothetical protein [Ammoniphilus oxalaticus]RKD24591.1 hypothetical protein BEP19_09445 [Ammoniphilus oxalaticus]